MTCICPTCNRPMESPRAPIEGLASIPVAFTARTIIRKLIDAYPQALSTDALVSIIYSGAELPEDAPKSVREHLSRVRRLLVDCGWTIINVAGRGQGVTGEYRLAPLEDA